MGNQDVSLSCHKLLPISRLVIDCWRYIFDYLPISSTGRLLSTGDRHMIHLTRHLTQRQVCRKSWSGMVWPRNLFVLPNLTFVDLYSERAAIRFAATLVPKHVTHLRANIDDIHLSRQLRSAWFSWRIHDIVLDFEEICAALPNLVSLSLITTKFNTRDNNEYTLKNISKWPLKSLYLKGRPLKNQSQDFPTSLKRLAYSVTNDGSHTLNLQNLLQLEELAVEVSRINLCANNISSSLQSLAINCSDTSLPIVWCNDHGPLFPPSLTRLDIEYGLRDSFVVQQRVIDELPITMTYLRLPNISTDALPSLSRLVRLQTLKCYKLTLQITFTPQDLLHLPRSLTKLSRFFGDAKKWLPYLPDGCAFSKQMVIPM